MEKSPVRRCVDHPGQVHFGADRECERETDMELRRTAKYVDLENACGGAGLVPARQREILGCLAGLPRFGPTLTTVATGPMAVHGASSLLWDWRPCRYLRGRGLNGADTALIEAIEDDRAAERFSHVVIVSGDHIFEPTVRHLRRRGVHTTVVARPSALSRRLARAASTVVALPELHLTLPNTNEMELV